MTVLHRPPSRRTIITSIQRRQGDEADIPDELDSNAGTIYAIDAVVEGKPERFFYIEYTHLHGGTFDIGCDRLYPHSDGVHFVLQPFVQAYVRGERSDDFPVDLGLV